MKGYRHGEICFIETAKIPELEETKSKVFAKGSHGHDHTFDNGKMYLLENSQDFIIGYLKAENTKLYHPEHSPNGCELPDGNYEIRKQQEHTPEDLIPVID